MHWKNILTILLLNIFLVCIISMWNEYDSMQERIQGIDNIVDLAVDTAITSSMASEELFSSDYASYAISSYGQSRTGRGALSGSVIKVFRNGEWITGNTYIMSMYYEDNGNFPTSQTAYNQYANGVDSVEIYEWLFGDAGSDYYDSSLTWANTSSSAIRVTSSRTVRPQFLEFYNEIGNQLAVSYMIKERNDAIDSFVIDYDYVVPKLTLMGLQLNQYNEVTSPITADNFTSSVHTGKDNSNYFLTPYSLGVTYIPVEVLKPTILSHLEQMIRYSKCRITPEDGGSVNAMQLAYASADGCTAEYYKYNAGYQGFDYYADESGNVGNIPVQHNTTGTPTYIEGETNILNDGLVEYDMSSLQVKVDYFVLDFYDNANWKIVNAIEGATPYRADLLQTLPERLEATNTGVSDRNGVTVAIDGNRIVARVTVRLKIHIPYESAILQWFSQHTSNDSNEHLDIKLWDDQLGNFISDYDGLWYQYTTYTAITR